MIRIQSSYKIIKRHYVSPASQGTSLIDTKIDYSASNDIYQVNQDEIIKDRADDYEKSIKEKALKEIEGQRESIIQQAMEEAEEIRNRARDTGYKEGYETGLEDGSKQGLEEGKAKGLENGYLQGLINAKDEAEGIKENAINMLEQAQAEVDKYIQVNEERIIKLAGAMAESIVHHTIDTSSEGVIQLIRPVIQQFRKVESIIITCHPDNYDYLKKSLGELEEKYEDTKFAIFEDDSLEKNGCIVENENQIVDLQIGKQVKNILEKMSNLE